MHESERNRLRNELARLRYAEADMSQAAAAARALEAETEGNGPLRRALETAIFVCYARPFKPNGVGQLGPEWRPRSAGNAIIHDALVAARDKVYAHTDKTEFRQLVEAPDGYEPGSYIEQWLPVDVVVLAVIIRVASEQQARMRAEIERVQSELQGHGTSP
jgi:hypothetical protein